MAHSLVFANLPFSARRWSSTTLCRSPLNLGASVQPMSTSFGRLAPFMKLPKKDQLLNTEGQLGNQRLLVPRGQLSHLRVAPPSICEAAWRQWPLRMHSLSRSPPSSPP